MAQLTLFPDHFQTLPVFIGYAHVTTDGQALSTPTR